MNFSDMALDAAIIATLDEVGYETPSPIQARCIPLLLEGRDVVGQAQTGTGKTAAFALPVVNSIDIKAKHVQALVLCPTRELAIQVAEAFQKYASSRKGFHVLPIYGGQDYRTQLRSLERGVHVVVGTPGRVMDHMRRKTLNVSKLETLVLDEADEMLRMGFIDDVEWILEQIPDTRQIALFSATMPSQIRKIANEHLNNPEQITIEVKTATADTIRQRFWMLHGAQKLDALTRLLETETVDAAIVFVRTKYATTEIAEKLEARGYTAAALSGDVGQSQRERTVRRLKSGDIDIIVATDVAARGLDVERISHVINYDIPYDTEAYIHRIGRTGRAGRSGDAILFVTNREKGLLRSIEKATRQRIEPIELPSVDMINERRISRFKERIADAMDAAPLDVFERIVAEVAEERGVSEKTVGAALARMVQGETPLLAQQKLEHQSRTRRDDDAGDTRQSRDDSGRGRRDRGERGDRRDRPQRGDRDRGPRSRPDRGSRRPERRPERPPTKPDAGMDRFRISVGHNHKVNPGNIVGAIANEAGLDSKHIGRISIYDSYSEIDLPEGMPKQIFNDLKKTRVAGQKLNIEKSDGKPPPPSRDRGDRDRSRGRPADRNSDARDQRNARGDGKPFKRRKPSDRDDERRGSRKRSDREERGAGRGRTERDRPPKASKLRPARDRDDRRIDRDDKPRPSKRKNQDESGSTIGLGSKKVDIENRRSRTSPARKRARRRALPRHLR